jgi:hypothetical protein
MTSYFPLKGKTIISYFFANFQHFHYIFINKSKGSIMKLFKKLVPLISLAFLTANFASNFITVYADGTTQVNITNIDVDSLSNSEKE